MASTHTHEPALIPGSTEASMPEPTEPLPPEPMAWVLEPSTGRNGADVLEIAADDFEGPGEFDFDEDRAIERAERRYEREIDAWGGRR